jgi:putative selenium metabolism protein SsnA
MLITNATIITNELENRIIPDQAIFVEDGRIAAIGPEKALTAWYEAKEILDAHFYGAFARGMSIPGPPAKDFPEILNKLWWPLDKALDEEAVRLSAQVMLLDAIRNGTTTLIDHHASPNAISGSLDVIQEAVETAGLRAVLCYEVTDRDGPKKTAAGIAENLRFLQRVSEGGSDLVRGLFGLHASLTLSDTTLEACRRAAPSGAGFHVHAAEHESDEYDSLQKSGLRVVDRLQKFGILGENTILAHGVHFDAREAAILAETKTWLSHQPRSNMNNGVGVAPVESLQRLGVRVCLGTDGFPHAMWEEARFAYMLQKVHHRDPRRMPGDQVHTMLAANNAALAGRFFSQAPLGVLTEGAHADLIFVDYEPHTPLTPANLPWQIIFGFHERMVTTTICAGKALMVDRELKTMDEAAITAQARALAPKVWQRYEEIAKRS